MTTENSHEQALNAVQAAKALAEAVYESLNRAASALGARGEDLSDVLRLQARAGQGVSFLNQLQTELQAADSVVGAPSIEEIRQVQGLADIGHRVEEAEPPVDPRRQHLHSFF